ncbi:MAG: hypothetical protein AAF928_12090 [Myxococcota bacterium]
MARARWIRGCVVVGLFPIISGCDPDTAVFVEPTLEGGALSLQTSSLGVGVGGGFEAVLRLGERASGASDVTLEEVSIADVDRTRTLVANVQVTSTTSFPVSVGVDEQAMVRFDLAPEDNFGDASLAEDLCAQPVVLVAVFDGSLRGGTVDAVTEPISPDGCP